MLLLLKVVHNKKSSKKKTYRYVMRQSCAVFCRNLWICDLQNNKNLRICNCGISSRICGSAICGLWKKFACPLLLSPQHLYQGGNSFAIGYREEVSAPDGNLRRQSIATQIGDTAAFANQVQTHRVQEHMALKVPKNRRERHGLGRHFVFFRS